jgi:hypothetical protein
MKKNSAFGYFILLCCLVFTSCFDSTTKININPDGSGTIEETVILSRAAIEQMKAMIGKMAAEFGSSQAVIETQDLNLFDESRLRAAAAKLGDGVTYQSGERIVSDQGEGYRAVYTFTDVGRLSINQNPSEKVPGAGTVRMPAQPKELVTFKLTRGSPNRLTVHLPHQGHPESHGTENKQSVDVGPGGVAQTDENSADISFGSKSEDSVDISFGEEPAPASDKPSSELDPQAMEMVRGLFENMKMSLILDFKGTISETNATYRQCSRVTLFEMDFGALLQNSEKLAGLSQEQFGSLEDVKGLIAGMPGFKVDMNEELYVEFQ